MKADLIKFAGGLNVRFERKRFKNDSKFLACTTGRMKLPFTEKGKIGEGI